MRILICEADTLFAEGLQAVFVARGHQVDIDPSTSAWEPDVVLVSAAAAGRTSSAVSHARQLAPHAHLVVVVDPPSSAVERSDALRAGAQSCVDAGFGLAGLVSMVEGAAPRSARRAGLASNAAQQPVLTPREQEVLKALVRGHGTAELAEQLGVSRATTRSHVQSVLKKLGVHTRIEAVATAVRTGMVEIDLRVEAPSFIRSR